MRHYKSRRKTPWGDEKDLTPTQLFLKRSYDRNYEEHHRKVIESEEPELVNSYIPVVCPYCFSEKFKKSGYSKSGVQRYMCECGKTFLPTTGTIFDEHKISISEWIEYCLNLFHHVSITADSWNNKNDFKTSRYWLQKLFLTLENVQNDVVLHDKIWLDETYYSVRSEDILLNESGGKLSGISQNKICIATATDKKNTILFVAGIGRPTQKKMLEIFQNHIKSGSTLIHDEEISHKKLVAELGLKSVEYNSKSLKNIADNDNPLNPINRVHAILKAFLHSHSGFKREHLQDYLNLFAFVSNPPHELLEKVELIVNFAFQNPKLLRYRDFFPLNTLSDE